MACYRIGESIVVLCTVYCFFGRLVSMGCAHAGDGGLLMWEVWVLIQ